MKPLNVKFAWYKMKAKNTSMNVKKILKLKQIMTWKLLNMKRFYGEI